MPKIQDDLIYSLIGKKLSGQISDTENDSLRNWINSSEEAENMFEDIKMCWDKIQFSYPDKTRISQQEIADMIWETEFEEKGL